jgi:hypothetical protein
MLRIVRIIFSCPNMRGIWRQCGHTAVAETAAGGRDRSRNCEIAAALASGAVFGFLADMDENTGVAEKSPRKERLARALRDNLKRRKAQARERAAGSHAQERASEVSERKG